MQQVELFLNKEMDRKEFLIFLGMLLLTIFGIKNIITAITSNIGITSTSKINSFGVGPYGGIKGGING